MRDRKFEYINNAYKKNFKAGMTVLALGEEGVLCYGDNHCHIRMKKDGKIRHYHPNDVEVIEETKMSKVKEVQSLLKLIDKYSLDRWERVRVNDSDSAMILEADLVEFVLAIKKCRPEQIIIMSKQKLWNLIKKYCSYASKYGTKICLNKRLGHKDKSCKASDCFVLNNLKDIIYET
jgi:hypothetical protein